MLLLPLVVNRLGMSRCSCDWMLVLVSDVLVGRWCVLLCLVWWVVSGVGVHDIRISGLLEGVGPAKDWYLFFRPFKIICHSIH